MIQAQLAAMVGVDVRTIQAYEAEARQPREPHRSRLITALRVQTGEEIGLQPRATVYRGPRGGGDVLSLRDAVAQVMAGELDARTACLLQPPATTLRQLRHADIERLRATTHDVATMVGRHGGGVLAPAAATRLWQHAARLLPGQPPADLVDDRCAAIVEHGITLSWAHTDAGAHDQALPLLLACLAVSRDAGPASDTLIGLTVGALVRWAILAVRFEDARELADEALPVSSARNLPHDVVTWCVAARACAAGHMGDVRATHDLLARAEDIASQVTDAQYVRPGDWDLLLGYGLASLELCAQRPGTAAAPVLARAATGMADWDLSRRALADSVHMLVRLAAGNVDAATEELRDLIIRAEVMSSCLVDTNILNARRVPAIELPEAAEVSRLVDAYATTLST